MTKNRSYALNFGAVQGSPCNQSTNLLCGSGNSTKLLPQTPSRWKSVWPTVQIQNHPGWNRSSPVQSSPISLLDQTIRSPTSDWDWTTGHNDGGIGYGLSKFRFSSLGRSLLMFFSTFLILVLFFLWMSHSLQNSVGIIPLMLALDEMHSFPITNYSYRTDISGFHYVFRKDVRCITISSLSLSD
jgi:hypothetical protein